LFFETYRNLLLRQSYDDEFVDDTANVVLRGLFVTEGVQHSDAELVDTAHFGVGDDLVDAADMCVVVLCRRDLLLEL